MLVFGHDWLFFREVELYTFRTWGSVWFPSGTEIGVFLEPLVKVVVEFSWTVMQLLFDTVGEVIDCMLLATSIQRNNLVGWIMTCDSYSDMEDDMQYCVSDLAHLWSGVTYISSMFCLVLHHIISWSWSSAPRTVGRVVSVMPFLPDAMKYSLDSIIYNYNKLPNLYVVILHFPIGKLSNLQWFCSSQ